MADANGRVCYRCQKDYHGPQAFLLTCRRCTRTWHHRCHVPPVEDERLVGMLRNNDLNSWACKKCLKALGMLPIKPTAATKHPLIPPTHAKSLLPQRPDPVASSSRGPARAISSISPTPFVDLTLEPPNLERRVSNLKRPSPTPDDSEHIPTAKRRVPQDHRPPRAAAAAAQRPSSRNGVTREAVGPSAQRHPLPPRPSQAVLAPPPAKTSFRPYSRPAHLNDVHMDDTSPPRRKQVKPPMPVVNDSPSFVPDSQEGRHLPASQDRSTLDEVDEADRMEVDFDISPPQPRRVETYTKPDFRSIFNGMRAKGKLDLPAHEKLLLGIPYSMPPPPVPAADPHTQENDDDDDDLYGAYPEERRLLPLPRLETTPPPRVSVRPLREANGARMTVRPQLLTPTSLPPQPLRFGPGQDKWKEITGTWLVEEDKRRRPERPPGEPAGLRRKVQAKKLVKKKAREPVAIFSFGDAWKERLS